MGTNKGYILNDEEGHTLGTLGQWHYIPAQVARLPSYISFRRLQAHELPGPASNACPRPKILECERGKEKGVSFVSPLDEKTIATKKSFASCARCLVTSISMHMSISSGASSSNPSNAIILSCSFSCSCCCISCSGLVWKGFLLASISIFLRTLVRTWWRLFMKAR